MPEPKSAFDTSVAATATGIPDYDALRDKHCTYTQSRAFAQSPYAQVSLIHVPASSVSRKRQRANDPPSRYNERHALATHRRVRTRRDSSTSELAAYKAIFTRENCLRAFRQQVVKFCEWFNSKNASGEQESKGALAVWSVTETKLYDTLDELRSLTLDAVDAVETWRKQVVKGYPGMKPAQVEFMWKGSNYLIKIIHDLDFIAEMAVNNPKYVIPMRFFRDSIRFPLTRNPLVTPLTLDEIVQDLPLADIRQMEKFAKAIGHAWARIFSAAQLIRHEEIAMRTNDKFSASIAQDGAASAVTALASSPALQKLQVNIPSPRETAFHVDSMPDSDAAAGHDLYHGATGVSGEANPSGTASALLPAHDDGNFFSIEINDLVALKVSRLVSGQVDCAVL
jgi:hypothetical protein